MKRFLPLIGIILLALSLSMLLAIICDYYDVYIPGIALLIPSERRPSPSPLIPSPTIVPVIRENLVIIEKIHTPSPVTSDRPQVKQPGPHPSLNGDTTPLPASTGEENHGAY